VSTLMNDQPVLEIIALEAVREAALEGLVELVQLLVIVELVPGVRVLIAVFALELLLVNLKQVLQ
jgi:hypothetical protein